MWTCALLLACLAAFASAIPLPEESDRFFDASDDYLHKQKQILKIMSKYHYPEIFPDLAEISNTYHIEEHIDNYEESAHVKEFFNYKKAGLLYPRDKIFNQFSEQGIENLEYAFKLMMYAKDFDAFIKTAVYLRDRYNLAIFHAAFAAVLEAREDTRDFYYPPLYEVHPYLFLDERIIQQAQNYRLKALQSGKHEDVYFYSNLTYLDDASYDPETTTRYFTEDVGLNAFSAEFSRRFPAWLDSSKYQLFHDRKGEFFLHRQRQLLARYYLERLSNNLGPIPHIDKDTPLPGYYPRLRFANGQSVTPRQPYTQVRDTDEIMVSDITYSANNLWRAIDAGYIYHENFTKISMDYPHGMDVLGQLVHFYGDSPNKRLYGTYLNDIYHHIAHLSDPEGSFNLPPTTLMMPETALRDPIYYFVLEKFFKQFYFRYLETVPKYKYEDVVAPGINIDDVHIDELVTYFDFFDVDLYNMIDIPKKSSDEWNVFARTNRLNHRPYTYKVEVSSEKEMDAVVKVFLTPKYDSQGRDIPLDERIFYSFEIDRFYTKLTAGKSTIERKCDDSTVAVKDPPTFAEFWRKVNDALEHDKPMKMDKFARPYGFPQRLLLPKGQKHGMPVDLVVAIYPYQQADSTDRRAYNLASFPLLGTSYNVKFPDAMPIDYPADRFFRSEHDCDVPNIFTKEVHIFHKTLEEINSVPGAHH